MNPTQQRIIAGTIFAVIIIAAGIYSWRSLRSESIPTDLVALSTTTLDQIETDTLLEQKDAESLVGGVKVSGTGSYTVQTERLPQQTVTQVPSFKTPVTCTLDTDLCAAISSKVAAAVAALEFNDEDPGAWVNLGTLRKMAGDYRGAAEAWEFVSKLYPTNPTSFSNLGDLYKNYLRDNTKAETNYLTSIKNYPQNIDAYRALAELYASGFRGGSAAEDILKKGIQAAPQAIDLQVLLARYYTSVGRSADAAKTYDAAITAAKSAGDTSLATSLEAEKAGK
ncbi:hypothetical protein FJY94_02615 [Candidatus Kaiserbacteria bacterium]|nr:hypothetical protein [Candidatus Kaiserbacteria bacterium]